MQRENVVQPQPLSPFLSFGVQFGNDDDDIDVAAADDSAESYCTTLVVVVVFVLLFAVPCFVCI